MAKVIAKSDTHSGLRSKLQDAVTAKHGTAPGSRYDPYSDGAYVQDVTDKKVIHSKAGSANAGKLFSSPYSVSDKDGSVKLGDPQEVEPAYKPVAEAERAIVMESESFAETAMSASPSGKTRELTVTIIKPGFNKSKSRYYTPKALSETGHVFAGAKIFINHQTKAEESARPEGSIHDWAGNLKGTPWIEKDGSLKSKATVHNEGAVKYLDALKESGNLHEMGVSIRAAGVQTPATMQGHKTNVVESFVACKSVDFVTFPGAGGRVDSMAEAGWPNYLTPNELEAAFSESDADDIDVMPLSVLRERRPDFVESITKEVTETITMKTVEQLETELAESNRQRDEATTKLTESENTGKRAAVKTELDTKLTEAALPKVAEDRIRTQFKEATDTTGIAEAITAEKEYLKAAGVAAKPGVKHMGEVRESATDPAAKKRREEYITESAKIPGWTKEMAESSADSLGL